MKKSLAVVALSGGLDSCVTLAIALEKYEIAALHLQYGQRTEKKELECFNQITKHYGITNKLVTPLPHLNKIKGSSLIDRSMEIEKGEPVKGVIPSTYVPFRNATILSVAVAWAEVLKAGSVFIGAVQEDSSGYPDCREEFFKSFEKTANLGTDDDFRIKIETPIIHLNKPEIIQKGFNLNAPLNLTWSCYTYQDKACGECESCIIRLNGFKNAGQKDPINYV